MVNFGEQLAAFCAATFWSELDVPQEKDSLIEKIADDFAQQPDTFRRAVEKQIAKQAPMEDDEVTDYMISVGEQVKEDSRRDILKMVIEMMLTTADLNEDSSATILFLCEALGLPLEIAMVETMAFVKGNDVAVDNSEDVVVVDRLSDIPSDN
ncbi:MAG: hypothetical protein KBT22_03145 [Bacteroidales bacterium]|nr:hypothetical protein [Candidatus Scybalocola fimicaballi]